MPDPSEVKQNAKREARRGVEGYKTERERSAKNLEERVTRLEDAVDKLANAVETLSDFI